LRFPIFPDLLFRLKSFQVRLSFASIPARVRVRLRRLHLNIPVISGEIFRLKSNRAAVFCRLFRSPQTLADINHFQTVLTVSSPNERVNYNSLKIVNYC